jgi:hypothetical protein
LFATGGADPGRSEERTALADADVVADAVDVQLFQPFPSCIEKCHDLHPEPGASTAFWPVLPRALVFHPERTTRGNACAEKIWKVRLVALGEFGAA